MLKLNNFQNILFVFIINQSKSRLESGFSWFLGAKEDFVFHVKIKLPPVTWSEESELQTNPPPDPTWVNWEPVRQLVRQEWDRMRDLMYPGWKNDIVLLQQFFYEEERDRDRDNCFFSFLKSR